MRIGWIGLGAIGKVMALRLLKTGHDLTVFARGAGLSDVEAAGAAVTEDYRSLVAGCDMLGICVFSDAQVRQVLLDSGTLSVMRPGAVLVLHTTGSPAFVRELADLAPDGVEVIDATFSGGPHDILRGNLTIMAGGDPAAIARVEPVLSAYAARIHEVGPVGQGQVVKLLNNLLFATNLMNAAEMLKLGGNAVIEAPAIASIIQSCSGASYAMQRFTADRPLQEALDNVRPYMEKDVATAIAAASEAGLDVSAFMATARYFTPVAA